MKKKPTKYLNYTIVSWVFGILSLLFEATAFGLYLSKWNGLTAVIFTLAALGFVFLGITIAMIVAINTDNDPSVKNEVNYVVHHDKKEKKK